MHLTLPEGYSLRSLSERYWPKLDQCNWKESLVIAADVRSRTNCLRHSTPPLFPGHARAIQTYSFCGLLPLLPHTEWQYQKSGLFGRKSHHPI